MTRQRATIAVALGGACASLLFVTVACTSLQWIGATFPGFFVVSNRVVPSISLPHWEGAAQLFQSFVVSVDGEPAHSAQDVYDAVRRKPAGSQLTYEFHKPDGQVLFATVTSRVYSWGDFALIHAGMALNGLAFVAIGLFVLYLKPNGAATYGLLSATVASGILLITAPDLYGPHWFVRLYVLAETLLTPAFVHLALVFPTDRIRHHRRTVLLALYAPFVVLAAYFWSVVSVPAAFIAAHLVATALHGVAVVVILLCMGEAFRTAPALVRRRIGIVVLGIISGVGVPLALMAASALLGGSVPVNAGVFTAFLFPLSLGYAIVQQNLFEIDLMLRRGITYITVLVAVTATYFVTLFVISLALPAQELWSQAPGTIAMVNLAVLLLIAPIRDRVRDGVDRIFYRKGYDAEAVLAQVGERLSTARAADGVALQVLSVVSDSLNPVRSTIALYEGENRFSRLAGDAVGSGEILMPVDLALRIGRGEVLARYEWEDGSGAPLPSLWRELEAEIVVPIRSGNDLIGVMILGPRASGRTYTIQDVALLQAIANHVVLAMKSAAALGKLEELNEHLEQQVRERTLALQDTNGELSRSLQELQRAYELLERNQTSLLRADRLATLGRLAAGMAHEINTPLGAVLNSLQVLLDLADEYAGSIDDESVLPEDHRQIAAEIRSTAESAALWAHKATGYLSRTKLHGRELQSAVRETFSVRAVADETQHLLAHRLRAALCVVEYSESPIRVSLVGDQQRLGQVLVNLVSNAIDAYEDNGIIDGRIEIKAVRSDDRVVLTVRDWAGGIPAEALPRIFDELFTTKDPGRGTGLGLWIARNLVEETFGGRLQVDVEQGVGSCFVATFPIASAEDAAVAAAEVTAAPC